MLSVFSGGQLRLSIKSTASMGEPPTGSPMNPFLHRLRIRSRLINPLTKRIYKAAPIKVYFARETLTKYGFKYFGMMCCPSISAGSFVISIKHTKYSAYIG